MIPRPLACYTRRYSFLISVGLKSPALLGMLMDPLLKAKLQKQRYHIVGEHGGVKVCHWTKESLLRDRQCYKVDSTVLRVIACKCRQ